MSWFIEKPTILGMQFKNKLPRPSKTGVDWFLFSYFLEKFKNQPMLEVGVGQGGSALTMLNFTKNLTIVDSWEYGYSRDAFIELANSHKLSFNEIVVNSQNFIPTEIYSFVHLDADKEYNSVMHTLETVSNYCTDIICVDDYLQSLWPEVSWAVDDWVKTSGWKRFFTGNHQVFLSKKAYPIKQLIADLPLMNNKEGYQLTYGKLPQNEFIDNGPLTYTWHEVQQREKSLIL